MSGPAWELFQHDADIGIRGRGRTRATAFEQAAVALTAVICDPVRVQPRETVHIVCDGADNDMLFVNWIDALIYEMAVRKVLFSRFHVVIDGLHLDADAGGEPVDVARHEPAVEVKGATLTELHVGEDTSGVWTAQCIVDV